VVQRQATAIRTSLPSLLQWLVAAAGALLLWYSSPWGVGVSPDSAEYISAARMLHASGDFFALPTQWAPGYPVLLSLAWIGIGDPFTLIRLLHCLLLAANISAGIAIMRHVLGRDSLLPVVGGLVLLVSGTLWQMNFYAWSEAPFLLCLQGSALALLCHLESSSRNTFMAAMVLAALALMFRYAGIAWVGAAALTLLLLQPGDWQQRLRSAVLFGVFAVAPFLVWLALNQLIRNETTNREFVVHVVGTADLLALLQQLGAWFGLHAGLLFVVAQIVLVTMLVRGVQRVAGLSPRQQQFLLLAGIEVTFYILFILFSKSFLDDYIPFDDRIFSPAWLFALLALLVLTLHLLQQASTQAVAVLSLLCISASNLLVSWPAIAAAHAQGAGYLSAYMATVSKVEEVSELALLTVYTNAPDYLRMRSDFNVHDYPRKYAPTTGLANPAYADEVASMTEQVMEGKALLVHYDGFDWRTYFPTLSELNESGYISVMTGAGVQLLAVPAAVTQ